MMDWEAELSPEQLTAVKSRGSPVLVLAGPGSGKCVRRDTLVWSNGLREFGDVHDARSSRIETGWGVGHVVDWYDDGLREGRLITLACGLNVDATLKHPLWVRRPDGVEGWVQTHDITTDDYVAVARGCADFGVDDMPLDEAYALGLVTADGGVTLCGRGAGRRLQLDKARCVIEHVMPVLLRWRATSPQAAAIQPGKIRDESQQHSVFSMSAVGLYDMLQDRYGWTAAYSHERVVPSKVLTGTRDVVRAWLRGYFDGDGYCAPYPELSTSSARLAEQVQILLIGLGVFSSRRTKRIDGGLPAHIITVHDVEAFEREVGFTPFGLKKDRAFAKLMNRDRNTNVDVIPYLGGLLREAAFEGSVRGPRAGENHAGTWNSLGGRRYARGDRMPSYSKLRQLIGVLKPSDARSELQRICDEHRVWSKVESIEPRRSFRVDCTVEGRHSFVGNGIVNHNTRTLTYRIAHLVLESDVDLERVLAITFTNKATKEMRERLTKMLGPAVNQMWCSTFHATCAKLLRFYGKSIGIGNEFVILDQKASEELTGRAMRECGVEKLAKPEEVASIISRGKDDLLDPDGLVKKLAALHGNDDMAWIGSVYRRYQTVLNNSGSLDFGDLIMKGCELLTSTAAARIRARFDHVLVDEFQDTNHAQMTFLLRLVPPGSEDRDIFVICDDDQAVYGWRGARVQNVLEFPTHYPNTKKIVLNVNYRCSPEIVKLSSALIGKNQHRFDKQLEATTGKESVKGDKPILMPMASPEDEAWWVMESIKAHQKEGGRYADCAVLYRTNAMSMAIEDAFRRSRIPYVLVGGFRFYDRTEIRNMLSMARLLANPKSDVDFHRIVNVPPRGIGDTGLGTIEQYATDNNISMIRSCKNLLKAGTVKPKLRAGIEAFMDVMRSAYDMKMAQEGQHADYHDIPELLKHLFERSGYRDYLKQEKDGRERIENVEELMRGAGRRQCRIDEWLNEIAMIADREQEDTRDLVTLSTIHKSKGLEFQSVFVIGVSAGYMPHAKTRTTQEFEEERRLLYVAMTRAKERLRMSFYSGMTTQGRGGPSSFLTDMGIPIPKPDDRPVWAREADDDDEWVF